MNILNKYTLEILRKNKTRTLVTIIGIILSVSMITAVTALVVSMQNYLLRTKIEETGEWYGAVFSTDLKELDKLKKSDEVKRYAYLQEYGYAYLEGCLNEDKPYLYIAGISKDFDSMMPVTVTAGRMPENQSEILIPKHVQSNGGVKYTLGQEVTFQVGKRTSQGYPLGQKNPYIYEEDGGEELLDTKSRTYTIVGFYERPSFEEYRAPGYTALTVADNDKGGTYSCYIKIKNPKNIHSFMKANFKNEEVDYNTSLLRYLGASDEDRYNQVLFGLAAILIVIIMFASIMLIYNAFSISVSERTKQFGLLSSIGASKRQLTKSVLFEAAVLSTVGIPIGVLSGNLGIGITLKLTRNLFIQSFLYKSDQVLKLQVSIPSLVIAALVGFITVLISAYIPARRAMRLSAVEAIRQTQDIKMKPGKLKTRKITYKLFGFEGMLASKNFKRNRRKYRATVVSLFVSVVLFITAGSFCSYMNKAMNLVADEKDYDLVYNYADSQNKTAGGEDRTREQKNIDMEKLYTRLKETAGVEDSSYIMTDYHNVCLQTKELNQDFIDYYHQYYGGEGQPGDDGKLLASNISLATAFVEDAVYEAYLKEKGYNPSQFMNSENPSGIAMDFVRFYHSDKGYLTYRLFNQQHVTVELLDQQPLEGYEEAGFSVEENGKLESLYYKKSTGEVITRSFDDSAEKRTLMIDRVIGKEQTIFGMSSIQDGISLIVMYPYSMIDTVMGDGYEKQSVRFFFKTDNHKNVYQKMTRILEEQGYDTTSLYDNAEDAESDRALYLIMKIFSYGFVILLSLIAAANVFNTISTNIHLRRMEFAMLKSMGMSSKGFHKMMNYECLLYGVKGILYGIPVSVMLTYLIYRTMLNGVNIKFYMPMPSVMTAVISVFIVVFATMLYSMNKIKSNNVIDSLKNENL